MAKYELTNGDYHLSSGARVPKSGIFIRSLKDNKQTNFYIAPTTVSGSKNSKLTDDKRLVLGRVYYRQGQAKVSANEFKNILSLARQLAINLGQDLIITNRLAEEYKASNQIVFKNLRVPMTFDEMKKFDEITIRPKIDNRVRLCWNVPSIDEEKYRSSYSYMYDYIIHIPESVKTKIDFSEIVQNDITKNRAFVNINSLDKDNKYSQNFSNIELVNVPEESYVSLSIRDEKRFTEEYDKDRVFSDIKLPKYKGEIEGRVIGIRNSEDKLVKIPTDLIREMHKEKYMEIDNNNFRSRYENIFQDFNRIASHNVDMNEDQKADMIIEEFNKRERTTSDINIMKEFSELRDFFERNDIKEIYRDDYEAISSTKKAATPYNLNDFLRVYDKHKGLFEKVIEKGSPKPENDMEIK